MPRKVIPDHVVEPLVRHGKTPTQIAKVLAEQHHIHVTPQAVSAWKARRGKKR